MKLMKLLLKKAGLRKRGSDDVLHALLKALDLAMPEITHRASQLHGSIKNHFSLSQFKLGMYFITRATGTNTPGLVTNS